MKNKKINSEEFKTKQRGMTYNGLILIDDPMIGIIGVTDGLWYLKEIDEEGNIFRLGEGFVSYQELLQYGLKKMEEK